MTAPELASYLGCAVLGVADWCCAVKRAVTT